MTQAKIYLPKGIDAKIKTAVLKRAAEKFGGFTTTDGEGGWVNPDGELIREPVTIVTVAGGTENWAQSTADWVSKRSNETEVMWQVSDTKTGFE